MNESEKSYLQARELWPDLLRIFAAFCIVLLHVASAGYFGFAPSSTQWQACNFYECSTRFAVPVFVMISGAFLLNPLRNINFKSLFHKIFHLVIIYFLWRIIYSLTSIFLHGETFSLVQFINYPPHYHLWFLPMLVGLYFYVPILRLVTNNKTILYYFLVLSVFLFFLPKLMFCIPLIAKESRVLIERFDLRLISGYTCYFLMGYFLYDAKLNRKSTYLFLLIGLLAYILTVLITSLIGINQNRPSENFLGFLLPNTLVVSIAVFVFFKKRFQNVHVCPKLSSFISYLSKLTFGVYLMHPLFLDNMGNVGLSVFWCHPFVSIPLTALLVFIVSIFGTMIVQRIPIANKLII